MQTYSLTNSDGHLYVTIDGHDWLLDTGAPTSFGISNIEIEQMECVVPSSYMGLEIVKLSEHVNHTTAGIIGADILNKFDVLIDIKNASVSFSLEQIELDGEIIEIEEFMGIPIVKATIDSEDRLMFFDTGAQISYFQDDSITTYPPDGTITDFFPGMGEFNTDVYRVDVKVGNIQSQLRCGSLPDLLGMTLMLAGTEGIIGNELIQNRVVGYFPRRQKLVLT